MKSIIVFTAIVIGFFTSTTVNAQEIEQNSVKKEQKNENQVDEHNHMSQVAYSCSMKCEGDKSYKESGNCPKCGMNLTKMETNQDNMSKTYICSMHPEVKSDQPGDCSKCGMVLVEKSKPMKMENSHKGHKH